MLTPVTANTLSAETLMLTVGRDCILLYFQQHTCKMYDKQRQKKKKTVQIFNFIRTETIKFFFFKYLIFYFLKIFFLFFTF